MPTLTKILTCIILLVIILSNNQFVFAGSASGQDILLPRVDLLPKGSCPVAPVPVIQLHQTKAATIGSSLSSYTKKFNKPYDEVFITAIAALEKSPITVVSFDTKSGRIFCNYKNLKAIYGLVESTSSNSTIFRITPADGNYNIPLTIINGIFHDMEQEFAKAS